MEETTVNVMETVITAMTDVFDLTGTVLTQITSQPCCCSSLLPA